MLRRSSEYQIIEHSNSADPVLNMKRKCIWKQLQADMNLKTTKNHHSLKLMKKEPQLRAFESKLRRETRMTSLRLPF